MRRIETLKDGTDAVGNRTRVKVVKNKMAPPFKEVEFDILYGQGVSREGDLVDLASGDANIIDKSGAWFSFNGERIGQTRDLERVTGPGSRLWRITIQRGGQSMSVVLGG